MDTERLTSSLKLLQTAFGDNPLPTIRRMEQERASDPARDQQLWSATLRAALDLKSVAGQVNVMVHTAGILAALPHILQRGERIESLSLGAGNTGKDFDLTTDRRVAEFKFIQWRGGPEAIRQNQVFKDYLKLLWDQSGRQRELYLTGTNEAIRFLSGNRALTSVLSRNVKLGRQFVELYGETYSVVGQFYAAYHTEVAIIDLTHVLGLTPDMIPPEAEELSSI